VEVDVAIIGSGFSGALLAWVLARRGRSVVLIDRAQHPRFAVGESSTPVADLLLEQLASQYDLPALKPLARYGTWTESYPQLMRGKKRGFSYFRHNAGQPLEEMSVGQASLLVAASPSDRASDTHWMRADVDAFFVQQAIAAGARSLAGVEVRGLTRSDRGWRIELQKVQSPESRTTEAAESIEPVECRFIVDASGAGQCLQRMLSIPDATHRLRTHSSTCYTHLHGVRSASALLERQTPGSGTMPFDADDAAQHHLLDDGWIWMLRFDDGRTSIGRVWRGPAAAPPRSDDLRTILSLDRYPSLDALCGSATLARRPGRWITSGRLQSLASTAVGPGFALMPPTFLRLDPLHSTGIAHGISGVERISACLLADDSTGLWQAYGDQLQKEAVLLDRVVAAGYQAIDHFELFEAVCSLYLVLAVHYEERRAKHGFDWAELVRRREPAAVWQADDPRIMAMVDEQLKEFERLMAAGSPETSRSASFVARFRAAIAPWNQAGLMDPQARRRYAYTATKRPSATEK
jgi:FADH2 O2-dependent halogenase